MTQIEIPSELPSILRNFTLSVLRTKPRDIIDHAVDYFTQLQRQQKQQSEQLIAGNNPVTTASHSSFSSTSQQLQQQTSNHNAISSGTKSKSENKKLTFGKDKLMTSSDRTNPGNLSNEHTSSSASSSPVDEKLVNENKSDDDDDEKDNSLDELEDEEETRRHYVKKNEFRRVSVAAERYNPEDDDSDDEQALVYPKSPEQRQRLKDAVCHSLLFRTLEAKQIDQILDAMWEKLVHQGDVIIRQGDDGDNFYVIDSGVYEIHVSKDGDFHNSIKVGEYNQTGSFGELALMYNQPRSATIIANTDGILWVMGRQTFRKLVLKHAFLKRQMYENFLRELEILQSLTDYERSNVADALIPIDYNQGETIIEQGEEGDRMFFIEDGECDIYMNKKFHKRLSKGEYFGELALLKHEPRSATVVAASPKVKLASLEVESFERLLGPCMDLIHRNTSKYLK
jgi:cAMP-dependent protein kinase regulator